MYTETNLRDDAHPRSSLKKPCLPTIDSDPRAGLQIFFKAYNSACLDFDADALSAFYDLPCLISTREGSTAFTARGELRASLARQFAAYRQRGLVSASLASLSLFAMTQTFARAEAVWLLGNARGLDAADLACAYTLRFALGRWRIAHALYSDATEKLDTRRRRAPLLELP